MTLLVASYLLLLALMVTGVVMALILIVAAITVLLADLVTSLRNWRKSNRAFRTALAEADRHLENTRL